MLPELYQNAIYVLFGAAVFLAIEAVYFVIANRSSYVRKVNTRLKLLEGAADQHEVMVQLRRDRGLSAEGRYKLPLIWFNRLILQSGIGFGIGRLLGIMGVLAAVGAGLAINLNLGGLAALGAAFAGGLVLPLLALRFLRRRRRRQFEAQLPDAVDVMVRSLRAGHPLPVAIAMVAREMPDPIGTEFGLTADELTYGLDLETAMQQMSARVGQEDFALVVVAISIQSKTGGNLSEILNNLAQVLRARFKMRRRIRSVSAEGRVSALGLSVLPVLVFAILSVVAPSFYGEVWHEPVVKYVLTCAAGFMLVGNFIMYRMVNFKL